MSVAKFLKRFNETFFAQEESVQETEEDRFLRFYRNLLSEISSHIEYQRDMTDNVGEKSKVLWTLVSAVGFGRRMARRQVYKRLSTRFEELG